ncbi:MAG TPA: hypothetical protein VGN93_09685 [Shinella sp.]|nr:hypothetical protein [Shinella sp.]
MLTAIVTSVIRVAMTKVQAVRLFLQPGDAVHDKSAVLDFLGPDL